MRPLMGLGLVEKSMTVWGTYVARALFVWDVGFGVVGSLQLVGADSFVLVP
jgi:hypothetical protein